MDKIKAIWALIVAYAKKILKINTDVENLVKDVQDLKNTEDPK